MIRRLAAALALLCAALAVAHGAAAQQGSIRPLWLTPEAEIGAMPMRRPWVAVFEPFDPLMFLGDLVFRAPQILGGDARRAEMACESCHPNGGAHTEFFIPGLSGPPGTVDVTHAAWNPQNEDGIANPIRIPSLAGIRHKTRFGHAGRFDDLARFVRHVIVTEFGGEDLHPELEAALIHYLRNLPPPPTFYFSPDDGLDQRQAQRGREAFGKDCAACHIPAKHFQDGRAHAIGGGPALRTPSLSDLHGLTRFMHDGRHASLSEAIAEHAQALGIRHGAETQALLDAYVARFVALFPKETQSVRLDADLARIGSNLTFNIHYLSPAAQVEVADMVRFELGRIAARYPGPGQEPLREMLAACADGVREAGAAAAAGDTALARKHADAAWECLRAGEPALSEALPASLYGEKSRPRF